MNRIKEKVWDSIFDTFTDIAYVLWISTKTSTFYWKGRLNNKVDSPLHVPAVTPVKNNVLLAMTVRCNHNEAGL